METGNGKLKKTLVAVATVVAVSLGSSVVVNTVHANPTEDIHSKQSDIKSQRSEVKKDLSKADAEIADILLDLKELNAEVVRVENEIKDNEKTTKKIEGHISKTEEEVAVLEDEIETLNENIEERNEVLKRRMISYQKSGGSIGFLEVILGAKDFNEFISRSSAVSKITSSDADLIKKQEEDKQEVVVQQENLEAKLSEQVDVKNDLEQIKEIMLVKKEEKENNQKELKNKEKEIKTLKAELTDKDSKLASVEADIRREIAAAEAEATRQAVAQTEQSEELVTLASRTPNNQAEPTSTVDTSSKASTNNSTQKESTSKPVSGNSGLSSSAISAGRTQIGTGYVPAGKGPGGFDCSGFVSWAYGQAGINIPSYTGALVGMGQKVSYSNIQAGDLVFFDTAGPGSNSHVGIYIGGGQFIGSQTSTGVAIASMSNSYWSKAFNGVVRRIN